MDQMLEELYVMSWRPHLLGVAVLSLHASFFTFVFHVSYQGIIFHLSFSFVYVFSFV
jgi:hypothetical protein